MKFSVRSSLCISRWCQPAADELVELGGELLPGLRERAAPCDVAGQAGVEGGQPGSEDAAVGLGEQHGDGASGRGELVAVGAGDTLDDLFAAQPPQVVGR